MEIVTLPPQPATGVLTFQRWIPEEVGADFVRETRSEGIRTISFSEPVDVDDGSAFLHFIALLRESISGHLDVQWSIAGSRQLDVQALCHLPPPRASLSEQLARVPEEWQAMHQYGSFYYRRGPGFIVIRDFRDQADAQRYELESPSVVGVFKEMSAVVATTDLSEPAQEFLDVLRDERIILRFDDMVTLLPYRMRTWPIPCNKL
ncbi:DUF5825 family protein [Micromonospora sp. CA-263727]|uniref:DUF5825 family protein n=1 Tax=Micromonospora sp. CA-263727 TaxID=3239967 RepID=UPI003D8A7F19